MNIIEVSYQLLIQEVFSGSHTVRDILSGQVSFGEQDVTIIAFRKNSYVGCYIPNASIVQWKQLKPEDFVVRGKLPDNILEYKAPQ